MSLGKRSTNNWDSNTNNRLGIFLQKYLISEWMKVKEHQEHIWKWKNGTTKHTEPIRKPDRWSAFRTSFIKFILPDFMNDIANFSKDFADKDWLLSYPIRNNSLFKMRSTKIWLRGSKIPIPSLLHKHL